jgi:hypothetical protein
MIPEGRRAVSGAYSSDIGQVFDGDRQTGEPTRLVHPAALTAHQAPRMLASALEAQGRERVEGGLHLSDAPLSSIDQLERRDVAAFEPRHRFCRGEPDQIVIRRHNRAPLRVTRCY